MGFFAGILFWDNPVLELPLPTHPVKECVVAKSIYDEEYRRLVSALRSARLAGGMTQQEVADRMRRPQSFVAKIEGCERRLDVVEFVQLCRALGVDPASFIAEMSSTGPAG